MAHRNSQKATRPLIKNFSEYQKIMAHMDAMLLDYLTHSQLPTRCKSLISMHLSQGAEASGLVHIRGDLFHGYEMVGEYPTQEVWVLPITVENHSLLAVWAVENDKYYLQDTSMRFRKIA